MKQGIFEIIENKMLAEGVYRMRLSGDVSAITASGQFINIKLDDHFLRRPISVCDVEPAAAGADGVVTIIYKVLGQGTGEMTQLEPGTKLDILTGLGNGYDPEKAGERPLLVGGGAGVPPLFLLARQLVHAGIKPTVILGYNKSEEIYYVDEFKALGCEVIVTTVDGSEGRQGVVTDAFKDMQQEGETFSYFYACGTTSMLKAVYRDVYMRGGTDGEMSFEERMGCGFGACMGCSVMVRPSGYKRICKEGPVFRAEEIHW
jgi:dihydroorotate dehydrogenase electron transfer subunit